MNEQHKVYDDSMGEISGFGGGYEALCRTMVNAGIAWVDAHPDKTPMFSGYKGVYGIINETNDEAEELLAALMRAAGDEGPTGAMMQACVSHVLAYKRLGWDEYRKQLQEQKQKEGE